MNEVKGGFLHKKLYLVLGVLCLVAIGLSVGIMMMNNNAKEQEDEEMSEEEMDAEAEAFAAQEREELYVSTDDYCKEMDEKIAQAENKAEKAQLYIEKAEELYARQASEERDLTKIILADLYKAEEIAPDANTAWMIFAAENDFGDEKKAEEYLKIAKDRGYKEEEGNG